MWKVGKIWWIEKEKKKCPVDSWNKRIILGNFFAKKDLLFLERFAILCAYKEDKGV